MRRILLICCLLLALTFAPISAQDDEEPPYLFYYSRILGGLIIEQADGTDSRLIAEDVIPPGYAGISGAGWSPSGRYFAALPSHSVGAYRRPDVSRPIVVDLNGNEVAQSLQWTLTGSTGFMEWSPHDHDLLLIWTHYRQTYQRNDAAGYGSITSLRMNSWSILSSVRAFPPTGEVLSNGTRRTSKSSFMCHRIPNLAISTK